jgi:hypothetical protein
MPGHYESCRKTDGKSDNPGSNFHCDHNIADYMKILFAQQYVVCKPINEDIQNSIGTTTSQVTKGLDTDNLPEGPVKKINDTYYCMS